MPASLKVHSIKNISGGLELLDLKDPIEILEYGKKMLVVNLPSKLREGVLVSLRLKFSDKAEVVDCSATGKIESTAEIKPNLFRTQIHLSQIEGNFWTDFLSRCSQKQGRADKVFSSIKGEES